jgi:hypothetical protein
MVYRVSNLDEFRIKALLVLSNLMRETFNMARQKQLESVLQVLKKLISV